MQEVLYIVVPCCNEENVLPLTAGTFLQEIEDLTEKEITSGKSRVLFVNDGSTDRTWDVIRALAMEEERYLGISLTRNCGTSGALLAGVREAVSLGADLVVCLDCDGQDDVTVIEQMAEICRSGKPVVYAVPEKESEENRRGRWIGSFLASLAERGGADLKSFRGDYCMLSSGALQILSLFTETDQDLEGILALTGLETAEIPTRPRARAGGKSREKARKKQRGPIGRIFDLTLIPLRLISVLGFGAALLSIIAGTASLAAAGGEPWRLSFCLLFFLIGILLFGMGVIGEYAGRIYRETKRRPGCLIGGRTWERTLPHKAAPPEQVEINETAQ